MTERRRHRKCWRPGDQSPGFILFIVIVTLLAALLSTCAQAEPVHRAPVVEPRGEALIQTGWLTYEHVDGVTIFYCVPQAELTLTCTAYIRTETEAGVVLLNNIKASEVKS